MQTVGAGTATNVQSHDAYQLSDYTDEMVSPQYQGFENKDGAWIIKIIDTVSSPRSIRFASGITDYAANWTNRGSLTYDTFSAITIY